MDRKLKILLSGFEVAIDRGGIQNTLYLFADYFSKSIETSIICDCKSVPPVSSNIFVYKSKFNFPKNLIRLSVDFVKLAIRAHKEQKINYGLAVNIGTADALLFLKIFYGIPYGVLVHGADIVGRHLSKNIFKNLLLRIRRYIVLKYADQIFANSNYTKNLALKYVSSSKITIINPPIEDVVNTFVTKSKKHILFSIARLEERKGFQYVLYALKELVVKIPDLKYYIAGNGSYKNELENIVLENNLSDHVVFLDRISDEDKYYYYKECGLFIMPSFFIPQNDDVEGYGIVYLEANSVGRFVIGSNSGGVPDAIQEGVTGFVVSEKNSDAIVKSVMDFYDASFDYDPEKCLEWAKKNEMRVIGEKYLSSINKILS